MIRRIITIFLASIFAVQLINPAGFAFAALNAETTSPPDFIITRTTDKQIYNQGDTAKIIYSITPTGQLQAPAQNPSEIIIAMDISSGMSGSKLSSSKSAAIGLINKIRAANSKSRIGVVSFGYKVNKTIALTDNTDSVSAYISSLNDNSLLSGSNFQDALEKSQALLSSSTVPNKYVVFISDGEPNYFTSKTRIKKYENQYAIHEDGVNYYTNYPQKTQRAYNDALTASNNLAQSKIVLYSIGIGSANEVDMRFLSSMSQATGGKAYLSSMPDSEVQIIAQISNNISSAKLSGLVIHDRLPGGISVINNSAVVPDSEGNISIVLPDIIYKSDGTTPVPFSYELQVALNNAGSYTLDNAGISYFDINAVSKSKPINSVSFTVNPKSGNPGLAINKQINKTDLLEGESAALTYILTPTGSFDNSEVKKPLDIVLLIDKSNGMNQDGKLANAKQAAENFVNIFKAANQGHRISLVTFNRYSRIEMPLTNNYDSLISSIRQITTDDGQSFDAGTNIEIGLKAAGNALAGSTNQKQIILLSDGVPTYYTDSIDKNAPVDYYYYISTWFYKGYILQNMKYSTWYNEPSNVNFYGSSMLDYNLQFGEYSYSQGTGTRAYTDAKAQATALGNSGITLNTICTTGGTDIDTDFMQELAQLGKGKAYTTESDDDLNKTFEYMAKAMTQQVLRNIKITETLPDNVEIISNEYIAVNGQTATINMPDIIFEKSKGTPSPVEVSFDLKFNTEGIYQLSPVSKLEYTDYKANAIGPINMEKLTVTVRKNQSDIANAELKAINGTNHVSVIAKGKFDAVVSFEVAKAGRLNLKLFTPIGSEELFASLSAASTVLDAKGNIYNIIKTADGVYLRTDQPLAVGNYAVSIKFSIGNIPLKTYMLQLETGAGINNPKLQIDLVPLPILM